MSSKKKGRWRCWIPFSKAPSLSATDRAKGILKILCQGSFSGFLPVMYCDQPRAQRQLQLHIAAGLRRNGWIKSCTRLGHTTAFKRSAWKHYAHHIRIYGSCSSFCHDTAWKLVPEMHSHSHSMPEWKRQSTNGNFGSHWAVFYISFLTDKAVWSSAVSTRGFIKTFSTLRDQVPLVLNSLKSL